MSTINIIVIIYCICAGGNDIRIIIPIIIIIINYL